MAQKSFSVGTYVLVCAALVLFTILTVAISFLPLQGAWHLAAGLAIAAVKMALVVLFFMHALVSNRVVWIVILVAGFWLGILVVLTMGDYLTRNLIPYTPGH